MRNQCYYQPKAPHIPTQIYSGCMTHDNINWLKKINHLKRLIILLLRSNRYTEEVQLFLSLSLAGQQSHPEHIEETFMLFGMRHQEFSYLWSFGEVSFNFRVQYILSKSPMPSGQNLVDSAGNPWGWWFLVKGIYMEIWVVNKTRTHGKFRQDF